MRKIDINTADEHTAELTTFSYEQWSQSTKPNAKLC